MSYSSLAVFAQDPSEHVVPAGPPPPSPNGGQSWDEMSTSKKVLIGGVVVAAVAGFGWLIYKRTQLYHSIAEKEGSTGVIKLTAADTASHLLTR